jgi:hypothetical protein
MGPKASVSVLVEADMLAEWLNVRDDDDGAVLRTDGIRLDVGARRGRRDREVSLKQVELLRTDVRGKNLRLELLAGAALLTASTDRPSIFASQGFKTRVTKETGRCG